MQQFFLSALKSRPQLFSEEQWQSFAGDAAVYVHTWLRFRALRLVRSLIADECPAICHNGADGRVHLNSLPDLLHAFVYGRDLNIRYRYKSHEQIERTGQIDWRPYISSTMPVQSFGMSFAEDDDFRDLGVALFYLFMQITNSSSESANRSDTDFYFQPGISLYDLEGGSEFHDYMQRMFTDFDRNGCSHGDEELIKRYCSSIRKETPPEAFSRLFSLYMEKDVRRRHSMSSTVSIRH